MFKKKKQKIELEWFKLSQTEYASGIEVYHTSLFFKKDKKKQKFILNFFAFFLLFFYTLFLCPIHN